MALQVHCPKCQSAIDVSPGQAGARLDCACGNVFEVPSLRELRALGYQPHDAVATLREEEKISRKKRVRGFAYIFAGFAVLLAWLGVIYIFTPQPTYRWLYIVNWAVVLCFYACFGTGFVLWARSKGYYGWLGVLLALWAPFGWFIIVFLPDRYESANAER